MLRTTPTSLQGRKRYVEGAIGDMPSVQQDPLEGNALAARLANPLMFIGWLVAVTSIYVLSALGGLTYAVVGSTVTLVWAPSGVALAAVLIGGYRSSLAVFLGAAIANYWSGIPMLAAVSIGLGNTLEALIGAFLLLRVAGFRQTLYTNKDVFAFIGFAGLISTIASATMGTGTLLLLGSIAAGDFATVWLKWWLGDMMGVLVVSPLLLLLFNRRLSWPTWAEALEALGLLVALIIGCFTIFGASEIAARGFYASSLAVFPFVIWGALRFEHWGANLVTLAVSVLAIWGTSHGTGPFAVGDPVDSLVRWCSFAIVAAVTGLLLAALVAEQRRAQARIRLANAELEQRVFDRTKELAEANNRLVREMAEGRRLEEELLRVSETQQQAMGRELHDGLGQHLVSMSLLCASLQLRLREQSPAEADAAARIGGLIEQATELTRATARGLFPVDLEYGGLMAALQRLSDDTERLMGVACKLVAGERVVIDSPHIALNLYRIAQEAISNAVRHGEARAITITVVQQRSGVQLSVSDDGVGMDTPVLSTRQGLGLSSMRHRMNLLGGTLTIAACPPQGTTVSAYCPWPLETLHASHSP